MKILLGTQYFAKIGDNLVVVVGLLAYDTMACGLCRMAIGNIWVSSLGKSHLLRLYILF